MEEQQYSSVRIAIQPLVAGFVGACAAIVLAVIAGLLILGVGMDVNFANLIASWRDNGSGPSDAYSVSGTADGEHVVDVVENVNPAVVSIVATRDVASYEQYYEDLGFGFVVPRWRESGQTQEQEVGSGSGFLVSSDGYVVTNQHVVDDQQASYTVFTTDGNEYEATVVAMGDVYDIALLKIESDTEFPYLEFADSDQLKQGQTVIAIGNALGEFANTVSVGVVSGLSRTIIAGGAGESELLQDVIQTDAAINSGNSGGPLLDTDGFVVGVNVAATQYAENIGFALPANDVKKAVDDMREHGRIIRAFLGVRYVTITEGIVRENSVSVDHGALVVRGENGAALAVVPGSPADKAGIEENDIILSVDGEDVTEEKPLNTHLTDNAPGDTVKLKVLHDGEEHEIEVVLEEAPAQNR